MGDQNPISIVEQVYTAFGKGDMAGMLALLHPDIDWRLPGPAPYAGHRRGHGGVREFFAKLEQAAEIQHFAPRQFFDSGDTVVVLGEERLRARATNRTMTQEWAHVFTIREGKVASVRLIEDTAGHAAIFDASPETLRAQLGPMGVTEPPFRTTIPKPEE
jgi:ketosteroid isomerase-like protein